MVITPGSVLPGAGAAIDSSKLAGETITRGMAVYLKGDGRAYMCQCDGVAGEEAIYGISLSDVSAGQRMLIQQPGAPVTIGATVVVGTMYVVSATFGKIAPLADLVSTNKITYVGYGISATQIQFLGINTGIALP